MLYAVRTKCCLSHNHAKHHRWHEPWCHDSLAAIASWPGNDWGVERLGGRNPVLFFWRGERLQWRSYSGSARMRGEKPPAGWPTFPSSIHGCWKIRRTGLVAVPPQVEVVEVSPEEMLRILRGGREVNVYLLVDNYDRRWGVREIPTSQAEGRDLQLWVKEVGAPTAEEAREFYAEKFADYEYTADFEVFEP